MLSTRSGCEQQTLAEEQATANNSPPYAVVGCSISMRTANSFATEPTPPFTALHIAML